jgi:hypothetical protein
VIFERVGPGAAGELVVVGAADEQVGIVAAEHPQPPGGDRAAVDLEGLPRLQRLAVDDQRRAGRDVAVGQDAACTTASAADRWRSGC